jgi:glucokinase
LNHAIGVDLGGTKIAAGIVDEAGTIVARHEMPSDLNDAASVAKQIADLVRALGSDEQLGVGIGAAGIVDYSTGYYTFGPNTGLHDLDLAGIVAKETGAHVRLDNDANCAAWAEHRFGVGRGTKNFICVTLGTGIGGGFVIDARPYRGAHGGAAEIGHILVSPDGPPCGCGRRGCWEQFASGLAMERMAREEVGAHPDSALHGLDPLRGPAITLAARDGDAFARSIVDETATWVGWGLGSLVNILEPECIAIAGGIVRDWDLFAERAHDAMLERMEASSRRPVPKLLAAALGPDAGIVGGALLVLDESA